MTNIRRFKPYNSITINSDPSAGDDLIKPFVYTEWLTRVGENVDSQTDYTSDYNRYIKEWNNINRGKKLVITSSKETYKTFLKNIVLNYTTTEEKRFLKNIDYDNPRHLEPALTFFANKLNKISQFYATQRESIKYNADKSVASGSKKSLETFIYNEIEKIISTRKTFDEFVDETKDYVTTGATQSIVNILELYEYADDLQESTTEQVDTNIFLDYESAVVELLRECAPTLEITPGLSLNVSGEIEVTDQNIELLSYENFENYKKQYESLNLENIGEYLKLLSGDDIYIKNSGDVIQLYEATQPWRDIYTRYIPKNYTHNGLTSTKLKSRYQLGSLYLPDRVGVLTYYSHKPVALISSDDDGIHIISNLNKYGTNDRIGIDHSEDVSWVKADSSNGNLFGDLIRTGKLPKFYSYSSSEENNIPGRYGISRSTDNIEFFKGETRDYWSNEDVFKTTNKNKFPIDERQETLLVGHETVVDWSTDIYGNEYALFKKINRARSYDEEFLTTFEADPQSECVIIDGGETLRERPPLWTEDVEFKIIEGGRKGGYDPKIEQSIRPIPFEDLRRTVFVPKTVFIDGEVLQILEEEIEEHNTDYMGALSGTAELNIVPITFHGFKYTNREPVYDNQAYCGLFTDTVCNDPDAQIDECVIRDNYAFGTFTEQISTVGGQDFYISKPIKDDEEEDAFEVYINAGYEDLLFTNEPVLSSSTIYVGEDIDGFGFADETCLPGSAEYILNNNDSDYYDHISNISRTSYVELEDDTADLTTYDQQNLPAGRCVFRSSDGSVVADLLDVMDNVLTVESDDNYIQYDRDIIRDQIKNNQVIDLKVYGDVVLLQTETHTFVEKIEFDSTTGTFIKSNHAGFIAQTSRSQQKLERAFKHMYNSEDKNIYTGKTNVVTLSGMKYIEPVIYTIDTGSLAVHTSKPNTNEDITLTDELSSYQFESIDTPIVTYNNITNIYTVSFTCVLTSEADSKNSRGVCIFDYIKTETGLSLLTSEIHHTDPVVPTESNLETWETKTEKIEIQIPPEVQPPAETDVTATLSLSTIRDGTYNGYTLDLTVDTRTIPLSTSSDVKINRIIFDAGDGSSLVYNDRKILTGAEPITFDITEIPDQSDFGDPRISKINHLYKFSDADQNTTVATLTAVYSNFKKLIVNIDIETEPYTAQTAFDDVKLIGSRTYSDEIGISKQMLILETQNPRHVSYVRIDKPTYTNSSFVGYVDDTLYSGEYHMMSDGTLMTDTKHNPDSQTIIPV